MMLPLVAAVAALALAICLVDLVLTLGVIRRLREQTEVLTQLRPIPQLMLAAGETVGPFEATTTTGEVVSRDRLSGNTLVAAFAVGCQPCSEQLPVFVDYAGQFTGGRGHVIAMVIAGDDAESEAQTRTYRERLEPVAQVVVEPPGRQPGRVTTALGVEANPVFGIVDDSGLVIASEMRLEDQPVAARA